MTNAAVNTEVSDVLRQLASDLISRGICRIHVLAWRDLDDPEAGGSEVHADEFMRRWASAGLTVTHRTSAAKGLPTVAQRSGYRVVRRGSRYSVFARTAFSELTRRMGPYDAVVEIWNGVPWMSPWWCRRPRITLLHHVHGPMWAETFPQPFAAIGRGLEERFAPRFYRTSRMVALSAGTSEEIRELGIPERQISCVLPGVDPYWQPGGERAAAPTVLAVGRLAAGKRFPKLLDVVAQVRAIEPNVQLIIVGEGPDRPELEAWISTHQAQSWITLAGRVSQEELRQHYRQAWLLTSASIAEGWGMTITEAGACATPAVVTNVNGHRDAVHHDETGVLAELDQLPLAIAGLLADPLRRETMGKRARAFANSLNWSNTADQLLQILHAQVIKDDLDAKSD